MSEEASSHNGSRHKKKDWAEDKANNGMSQKRDENILIHKALDQTTLKAVPTSGLPALQAKQFHKQI
jgi:hypothetical protein